LNSEPMNISSVFIQRPVATVLVMFSLALFGIFAFFKMPVSDLPAVDYPVIEIMVSYPGATPENMAANVATPLEQQFMQIQGIELMTSMNSQGNTLIIIQFDLNKNIDAAANDVQAAISRAMGNLPKDLPSPPQYKKTNPNEMPMMYYGLISETMSTAKLYDYAYSVIGNQINIIDGVSQVQVYGVPYAVRIEVDPNAASARGLTLDDICDAVGQGTVMLGSGQFDGKTQTLLLQPQGQLENAAQYDNLIIGMYNGSPVHLRDVAKCRDSIQDTRLSLHFWSESMKKMEHKPVGMVVAVTKAAGANAVEVSKRVRDLVKSLDAVIPDSIQVMLIHDLSQTIVDSINDVQQTLVIAFCLVVAVIFFFLGRVRDTIIPSLALPLSLLITFVVMLALDYSLDNLSLMGLTLCIGFLVDDAIVFLENSVRRMERGENAFDASMRGAEEIGFTILSMTLSLGAVFLPLVFMSGLIGRVFREFSIVVVVAILASGFVSLTLTPMMCRFMLTGHSSGVKTRMEKIANDVVAFCLRWYGVSLHWFLKRRLISLVAWFVTLGATVWLFMLLPKSFLPVGDSGVIRGMFMAKTGTSPQKMVEYQEKIDKILQEEPAVKETISVANLAGANIQANQALTFIFLRDRDKRKPIHEVTQELISKVMRIPGIFIALRPDPTLRISAGATSETQGQYSYVLTGLDQKELYENAAKMIGAIGKIPGVIGVSSDMMLDMPNLTINILRDKASYYGVSAEAIEMVIRNAYAQNYVYLIKSTITQYQVIVEVEDEKRANAEDLNNIYVMSRTLGKSIPLRAVCSWEKKIGPSTVNHLKQFPAVTIFFNLAPDMPIGTAQNAIDKLAASMLPASISRAFYGEAQLFAETVKSLTLLLFVAVFVMYVIMGVLYESYFHPITVLSALPVACVGGLLGLLIFGQELSLYAFIGLFMLMGIVKKNGILMVDFAIHLQKHGKNSYDAVHEACLERFRPIIMTTLAALMGAMPIAVGYGADGESRMGLGITVVAGLVFSQIITLYITPVIYLYLEDVQEWVYGEKRGKGEGGRSQHDKKVGRGVPPSRTRWSIDSKGVTK